MGTRSDIIVHLSNGKWKRIYCHWDGYLEHNGRILFDHYTSQKKAEALVALGDISSLGPNIGKKIPFDRPYKHDDPDWDKKEKQRSRQCVAYGRDRGETRDISGKIGDTLQEVWPPEDTWTEFTYVWHDDGNGPRWWVTSPDEGTQTLVDLGQALTGEISLRCPVKVFGVVIGQHGPSQPDKGHTWSAAKSFKDPTPSK